MSCKCKNTQIAGEEFVCTCDQFEHPPMLNIDAGLSELPRQIAGFPEFRRAMLFRLRKEGPLSNWRARDADDLGIMLIEMWAYICDNLTFYDKMVAQESYLRTAQLRPSLRKLVALLGYLPNPAVGATVELATLADGRMPINLPKGTSFRSGAFEGNPPQVFELDKDTFTHPLSNQWSILSQHIGKITTANPSFLLIQPQTTIQAEAFIFLLDKKNAAQNQVLHVSSVSPFTDSDKRIYTKITFYAPTQLAVGTELNGLRLMLPTQTAALWTIGEKELSQRGPQLVKMAVIDGTPRFYELPNPDPTIALDNLYKQINAGDYVVIIKNKAEARWSQVSSIGEVNQYANTEAESKITINKSEFSIPRVPIRVTQLSLLRDAEWANTNRKITQIHYGLIAAGMVVDEAKLTLAPSDPLEIDKTIEMPDSQYIPPYFLMADKNTCGVAVEGTIQTDIKSFKFADSWSPDLLLPVTVYGNIVDASRGETVKSEILGSGNAAMANQTFKLKKKPLTYLFDKNTGTKNTLKIRINGIEWTEVTSFYGKKPYDPIYIVRQNDDEDTYVTFGDGIRGQRLPSNVDNVVASYRFGAGRASPPVDSITQIGKPVKGLQSVKNPVAAAGGADREAPEGIRRFAPKSALILGRAVSIQDMEAVTLSIPGVRAAQVEWAWNAIKQRAVVQVWYIGEDSLEENVRKRLRSVSDPTTPIQVKSAIRVPSHLSIDIKIDPRYVRETVLSKVTEVLYDPEKGILVPENVGIGKPFFRSRLFEAVLSVEGTTAVQNVFWNTVVFSEFAKALKAGEYFNFEQSNGLLITNTTPIV
jgi:hypothetical protein